MNNIKVVNGQEGILIIQITAAFSEANKETLECLEEAVDSLCGLGAAKITKRGTILGKKFATMDDLDSIIWVDNET
jgi:hypothetical protein